MQDTVAARSVETKTRVFISYSRKDMAFADKLEAALKARGFQVLIDRQEIYAFEDWWKRIEALIGRADTVVGQGRSPWSSYLGHSPRRDCARK